MKITKAKLRQIIREELQKEGFLDILKSRDHDQKGSGGSYRVEIGNTQGVLDGDLDPFISESLKQGV